jgi:hypothetical protein
MAVDEVTQAEHRQLLAASMANELERRAAAARRPGQGLTLDSADVSYVGGAVWQAPQVGAFFGTGYRPAPHQAPVAPPGDPLVGGVAAAGAAVVAPGSRRLAAPVAAGSAPVGHVNTAHNRGGETVYVDAGPRRGLLGRIIDRLRGGAR